MNEMSLFPIVPSLFLFFSQRQLIWIMSVTLLPTVCGSILIVVVVVRVVA
jgi:hypothetical protein